MTKGHHLKTSVGKKAVVCDMEFGKMLEETGEQSPTELELGSIGKRNYKQRDHEKMREGYSEVLTYSSISTLPRTP